MTPQPERRSITAARLIRSGLELANANGTEGATDLLMNAVRCSVPARGALFGDRRAAHAFSATQGTASLPDRSSDL